MKTIDLNRFTKVMSRLILVRRRSIIKLSAGFLIGFFVIAIISLPFFDRHPVSDYEVKVRLWGISPLINTIFAMSFFVISTFIINDLGKRQQRINEMMLPATNLEKFLARALLVSVVYPLLIAIAFIAADGLQQLTTMLVFYGGKASLVATWYDCSQTAGSSSPLWVKVGTLLLINSFALFGGMFFRKAAWLKTLVAFFAIVIAIAISIAAFAYFIYEHTDYELVFAGDTYSTVISNIFLACVIMVLYWGAYKLYTRLQVINNRWRNS